VTRPLAIATAIAFAISTAFPTAACLVADPAALPRVWGVLDVAVAAILAGLAITVAAMAEKRVDARAREATYRIYRVLLHGLLAGVVIFLTLGDRITWTSCLVGFAWRAWLLLYTLPAWLVAVRRPAPAS
jgi:hypothetical protein